MFLSLTDKLSGIGANSSCEHYPWWGCIRMPQGAGACTQWRIRQKSNLGLKRGNGDVAKCKVWLGDSSGFDIECWWPKAHLCNRGLCLEGNCSEVISLAILVCASVQTVFRRAFDLTSWSNMTLLLTRPTNVIIAAVTSMFSCPATTAAMHLFTSPIHTLKCLLLNSSEQQGKKGGGRRRKLLKGF